MRFAPVFAREAGVSDRANYVALPSVAGRGQDEGGESRRIGGGNARPVPEERSPRPKSPPNSSQACADCVNLSAERREATRFLFAEEANQHLCALRRSMPLMTGAR